MANAEDWLGRFEDSYHEHAQRLFRYVYRMTGDRQQSEDIVHEVFVRVFGRPAPPDTDTNLPGLIWVTARNLTFSHLERRGRLKVGTFDNDTRGEEEPAEPTSSAELKDAMNGLIEKLPDVEREVILMKIHGELTYGEMARCLGCSVGTIKSRMNRAFRRLRRGAAGLL